MSFVNVCYMYRFVTFLRASKMFILCNIKYCTVDVQIFYFDVENPDVYRSRVFLIDIHRHFSYR